LEIFDHYHLIIKKANLPGFHTLLSENLYYDSPEIQSASLLYTSIGNVTYLSSDNPEIQSSSHYSQGL
jgi:hypothetical protein